MADRIFLTFAGIRLPLAEHAKRAGLPRQLVATRISYGWSADEALTTPADQRKPVRAKQPVKRKDPRTTNAY